MKIERGIPIPALRGPGGKYDALIDDMQINDCVVLDKRSQVTGFLGRLRKRGFAGVSRTDRDGVTRVWKIDSRVNGRT